MSEYILNALILTYIFISGACIGSFGNVLIYRLPRHLPFVRGRSFCPACGKNLKPADLIPIFSWLLLGGKCRYCGNGISTRYPAVELITGSLAVLSAVRFGLTAGALCCFFIFFLLLTISFIDGEHMIIPNGLVIALGVFAICYAALDTSGAGIMSRGIGFFALSVPMFILTLFIPNAFGFGDVKLIAVCGLLLGLKLILLTGFIAVMLGGLYGVYKKYIIKCTEIYMAFGQYICTGTFIAMLCGDEIIRWYAASFFYI